MFQAGAVTPSSLRLLQLLTGPAGDFVPVSVVRDAFEPPVRAGLNGPMADFGAELVVEMVLWLVLLTSLPLLSRPAPNPFDAVERVGLVAPPLLCPTVVGNFAGLTALATLLKATRHWMTCAGSLDSNKSTVRKRSCAGMLSGGDSHARRKCEMFSI